ncbi:hypothetical protein KP509_15G070500 [Ceratopteris richardii]|uniref:Uncharacterized protein n=1 Tax=Ceratopteris richardii TaxID=49495 RepID=A0A8T2T5X9_CERRI|nr:hypothetical protein KP509_15G070500 [Ceratopteris richardii]
MFCFVLDLQLANGILYVLFFLVEAFFSITRCICGNMRRCRQCIFSYQW